MVCVCVLPGAQFRRCIAKAHYWYLQGGWTRVVRRGPERPGRQEGGAKRRVETSAEMQRGAWSTGDRVLLLITLLILTDGRQLLY